MHFCALCSVGASRPPYIHYLDDFLFCGSAGSGKCTQNLASALTKCRDLGVTVAEHKTQGPSTLLAFLGIEIDTVHMQLRLPLEAGALAGRNVELVDSLERDEEGTLVSDRQSSPCVCGDQTG